MKKLFKRLFSREIINWKLYWVLMAMVLFSTILGQPYITKITGKEFTWEYLIMYALPINVISSLFAVYIGLIASKKIGMGAPIIEAYVNREPLPKKNTRFALIFAPLIGIAIPFLTMLTNLIPGSVEMGTNVLIEMPTLFEGILGAFYGGMFEEITSRLFIMSLYVWLFSVIISKIRGKRIMPSTVAIWMGIVLAGIIFGIAHVYTASLIADITSLFALKVILANGIGGVIFGILYWKKGLESAMIAHFTTDIVVRLLSII
jgi:hypothetical protein